MELDAGLRERLGWVRAWGHPLFRGVSKHFFKRQLSRDAPEIRRQEESSISQVEPLPPCSSQADQGHRPGVWVERRQAGLTLELLAESNCK